MAKPEPAGGSQGNADVMPDGRSAARGGQELLRAPSHRRTATAAHRESGVAESSTGPQVIDARHMHAPPQ